MADMSVEIGPASVDGDNAAAVAGLLALAVGGGQQRLTAALNRYRADPAARLLVVVADRKPVAVAGYVVSDVEVTLLHIATAAHVRRTGLGSALLRELRSLSPAGLPIVAETDVDGVAFYVSNGFAVRSLGEKYPGVERFSVRYTAPRPAACPTGQVILLNGASSSGKSTIARQLLSDLDTPWFHMGVDVFGAMRSERRTHEFDAAGIEEVLRRTRAGFHRAVAGMAYGGNNIVMDHVLSEPWRLDDLLTVMEGIDVVFVGVRCTAAELQRREHIRGDRPVSTAAKQINLVHDHSVYDLEIDTTVDSAQRCSAQIRRFLERYPAPGPRAFDRLRARRSSNTNMID